MTHATFAVLDNERNLPCVPGRRNRDYSIWDFDRGGRFYTVFPYFHLAGFLSLLINPIFTEASSPVLGPPLMPPSGSLLKEVMRHQKLRALYLPPSIAEQLLQEHDGLEFFKGLDFLCYTGGPFSPTAGGLLSTVTELCPLYGSTEAFQVPQLAPSPEDWAWMEWNPHFKLEMQPSGDQPGTFELVLFVDESTKNVSALNHNLPGVAEYRTKDLFKQHPQKPRLWQYYGRRDDIIVLSNGEKFNPIPMELKMQAYPSLSGALVVGQGRSRATLLVEPKANVLNESLTDLDNAIWPHVEEANRLIPAQGRILRSNIIVAKADKPFARAGKGTIVRKLTEKLYESEIEAVYENKSAKASANVPRLQPTMVPHFETSSILAFIRGILIDAYPDFANIQDDDDLFSYGLDSVIISQLLSNLKAGLIDSSPSRDIEWLDTRTVYRNSSLKRLASVVSRFLNSGNYLEPDVTRSRTSDMDELILKYTQGLKKLSTTENTSKGRLTVALVGSTGYLGPQILASLMANSTVSSIYCLNRSTDAKERTAKELEIHVGETKAKFDHVKFLVADIGARQLGLSDGDFAQLSQVNSIVYNAWRPDFSLPISSFEKPFLSGLRNIIDWSCQSLQRPRITFISSVAAVGHWPIVFPQETVIPEAQITDNNVAMHMGYGESKGVAERILHIAHKQCGIPVNIIRTGQIGGPSSSSGGQMPEQGWLLALCRASRALGALPTRVAALDWLPVDALAKQISEVVANEGGHGGYRVFNLVHPDRQPWDLFLNTLMDRRGLDVDKVSLPEWLDKLDEKAREDAGDHQQLEAWKIADFLRSLGDGMEHMKIAGENIGKISKFEPELLNMELLEQWVRDWKF
jgi:thioester reductase-like protein